MSEVPPDPAPLDDRPVLSELIRSWRKQRHEQRERAQHARVSDELRALARKVRRLAPHRQNPETFYTDREDVADRLDELAKQGLK